MSIHTKIILELSVHTQEKVDSITVSLFKNIETVAATLSEWLQNARQCYNIAVPLHTVSWLQQMLIRFCGKYSSWQSKQIQVLKSTFEEIEEELWQLISVRFGGKYSWKSKQIQALPLLRQCKRASPTLKPFLDTLWWTWVIFFDCRQVSTYMGRLASHFPPVWCTASDPISPLLFLHPLSEGRGTRLTIRNKYTKKSDCEMSWLV